MKPLSVLLWSLVGMATTSGTVALMTPTSSASAASPARPVASTKASAWASETAERAGAKDASALVPATVAAPTVSPRFVADGLLHVEGRLGHTSLPRGEARESFVFVSIDAPADRRLEERPPIDVGIVIDRSGSMKGSRLRNAVAAARGMVERLGPDDRISLVAYDGRAELLLPSTRVGSLDRLGFDRTLARLRHGGNTCLSCGLELAMAQLRGRDGLGRVLLLSDGQANRGLTTPDQLRSLGDMARGEQLAIASIGVDVDYDERTMFAVSEASNGEHYFVEDPRGLSAVFEQERVAMAGTVADEASVDVTLAAGVELLEVVDRPHQRRGETIALSLGSFAGGDAKTVLLRVRVRADEDLAARPVASVRLSYRDLGQGRIQTHRAELGLPLDEPGTAPPTLDPAVEARLGRKDAFDALLTANEAFDRGDLDAAERTLASARREIESRRQRTASAPAAAPAIDDDFERQLQALGSASTSFDEASRGEAPASAPRRRKGKAATKSNMAMANPFSD